MTPVLLVVGSAEGAGATTVAVGLASRLSNDGRPVRLERLAGDDRAASDAAVFVTLDFASSSGAPMTADALEAGADVTVVEAPAGADAAALAKQLGARLVIVAAEGEAPAGDLVIRNHARGAGPLQLPENRLLAAPTVGELAAASGARVLARSSRGDGDPCEYIVVGAVASDSDEPYFDAFPRKAVVTRAEKVDIALSALRTDTRCLILTGGGDPSPYLLDRVASTRDTTLLLAPEGTIETVRDIEGTFGRGPFAGADKVQRITELFESVVAAEALEGLLAD